MNDTLNDLFEQLSEYLEKEDYNEVENCIQKLDQVQLVDFLTTTTYNIRENFIKNHLINHPNIIPDFTNDLIIEMIELIGEEKFGNIIKNLPTNEIIDILEDLDHETIKSITKCFKWDTKRIIKEILSYPEESAGRLIHKDFIVIPKEWNIDQVLQFIRAQKKLPKYSNEIFVVDDYHKPIGSINLNDILFSKSRTKIESIMNFHIKTVNTDEDQEDVAKLFQNYSLNLAAVVNQSGEIIGVISIDDVIDVITEEAEEDILHAGKVSESDINATIFVTVFKRIKWLIITFLSINFSSYIIGFFDMTLKNHVELAILMPIIAAMGGNAGIQASTVAVRAIVTNQLTDLNAFRLLIKELLVGFCNGLIMSFLMIIVIMIRFHNLQLEYTFITTITLVFTLATSVGAAIPFIVEKLGGDPALSSSIITSSFTDILAFTVLLSIATLILS
jgi:magnesium transporter